MKVLVCGGRHYSGYTTLCRILDAIEPTQIVSGGATGADSLAERYAKEKRIKVSVYPADWGKHGRAAGPIRNERMLNENLDVDIVVAFRGGAGTKNMTSYAEMLSFNVIYVDEEIP